MQGWEKKEIKVKSVTLKEKLNEEDISDLLMWESYVPEADVKKAKQFAKSHHISAVDYLLSKNLITKNLLGQAISEYYEIAYADFEANPPTKETVLKIPEEVSRKFHAVLFKETEDELLVAADDPTQKSIVHEFQAIRPGKKVRLAYALPEFIDAALVHYRKTLATRFGKILEEQRRIAPEIIQEIINDALILKASDVHFEPQESDVIIRFRVDGVLHETARIKKDYYENILNRIKVQASLRIDEHFAAQDGAIRFVQDNKNVVDLRVSITPTLDGEKIVIRLLSEYIKSLNLYDLGLSEPDQEILSRNYKKPFGMIIVCGPTGSGKTTTLYAILKEINQPEVNITTIEDPVEYRIPGVNQIQVNPDTNLTFAEGLKSIVRQDPDIILVGEIRDQETAEISINAALTGHLLLSTFHANDAATAIPRLLDMGVEPFLLASTLELVISQRLVRRICGSCRTSHTVSSNVLEKINPALLKYFPSKEVSIYKGKGCSACQYTGFSGRIAIYEMIEITKEMEELCLHRPSAQQIWQLARKQNSRYLFEDGIEKVKNGITTVEELMRVAMPPE